MAKQRMKTRAQIEAARAAFLVSIATRRVSGDSEAEHTDWQYDVVAILDWVLGKDNDLDRWIAGAISIADQIRTSLDE